MICAKAPEMRTPARTSAPRRARASGVRFWARGIRFTARSPFRAARNRLTMGVHRIDQEYSRDAGGYAVHSRGLARVCRTHQRIFRNRRLAMPYPAVLSL